ncbi:MAG: hypothetical protein LBH00_12630 [Planctomycetaceae bacterium]|jgi:pimeloyl-ACP methyl ester carboxylesterase|nr:hypothetical protein [Planctomycetaceae bacterium]
MNSILHKAVFAGHLSVAFLLCFWFVPDVSAYETVFYRTDRNRSIPVKIDFPNRLQKSPVILISHGIGSSISGTSYLAEAWTARGFVCVSMQHPGSDENIWKGKIRILDEFKESYARNWSCRTRAEDIVFVLNRIEQLVQKDKRFAARMDMDRVGVAGIDLGALASLLVAGQVPPDKGKSLHDPRIKAVLAMSPPVRYTKTAFHEIYSPITVPALFITGTEDDGIVGPTKAKDRRIPFDSMSHAPRYLITLEGAGHRIYGGRVFSAFDFGNDKYHDAIVRSSSRFWNAALRNDSAAIRAMNTFGWQSLVGLPAFVERRSPAADTAMVTADTEPKTAAGIAPETNTAAVSGTLTGNP